MTKSISFLASALLISGCALWAPVALVPNVGGRATVSVLTEFRGSTFRTQALIEPYTGSDVEHLVLALYTVSGSTETPVRVGGSPLTMDVPKASLGQAITFENLHNATTYRVKGSAYKASGTADADLISVAGSSSLDIAVTNDDRPTVATLSIQLVDRTFSGQGTNSIEFTDGNLTDVGEEQVE